MALHSESEMAFLSQESVSTIKNSELNEGVLVQLENSAKPESTKQAKHVAHRTKQQWFQQSTGYCCLIIYLTLQHCW